MLTETEDLLGNVVHCRNRLLTPVPLPDQIHDEVELVMLAVLVHFLIVALKPGP